MGRDRSNLSLPSLSGRGFDIVTTLIAVGVLFLIIYPLFGMLRFIFSGISASDWARLFSERWFWGMIVDTVTVVGLATVFAVVGAICLAWVNERTDASLGRFGDLVPIIPLFLPSVAVAIGWVLLGTPDVGYLNRFLSSILTTFGIDYQIQIYSRFGVAAVIALVCLPFAYLPIAAGFKSIDPNLEEAARTSGAGPLKVALLVAIPAIRPAIQAALVLVLIVGLGQFAAPEVIGTPANIDVMAVRIIRSIRNTYPPDYETAVMLSTLLFIVLALLWVFQQRVLRAGQFSRVTGRERVGAVIRLGPFRWVLRAIVVGYLIVAVLLPLAALVIMSFQAFWQPNIFDSIWTMNHYTGLLGDTVAQKAIRNSLLLALGVGMLVVIISAFVMYYGTRRQNWRASFSDATIKLPAIVPNLIVGIAVILAFGGPPIRLGGTLIILAIGYLIVSIPYAAIASETSFAAVHPSLREAAYMSGASERETLQRVIVPLVLPGLSAAWALVFVHILGDLVISVLLGTGATPVIGYLLLDIWQQGSWGGVASLALMMTFLSTPIVGLMLWLGVPRYRRKSGTKSDTPIVPAEPA